MTQRSDSQIIDIAIRLVFIGLFVFAALQLMAPMLGLLLWAVILTVAVYPAYEGLSRLLGGRQGLAAVLITLLGLVITLGPLAMLGMEVVYSATAGLAMLKDGVLHLPEAARLADIPVIGETLLKLWGMARDHLADVAAKVGPSLLQASGFVLGRLAGMGVGLLLLAVSVLIMGLLFRPGPELAHTGRRFANRVFAPRGGDLVDLAGATVRNVSRGVIGVAVIQALLAGIIMVAFGVPLAGPLALAALFLAIIQIGPGPVILPVLIWAWFAMSTGTAILFIALMLPVMIVDNFLRPVLMARGLETPMLVILAGVMGGVMVYGLVGLFIGPVILAVFYELLLAWMNAEAPEAESDPSA